MCANYQQIVCSRFLELAVDKPQVQLIGKFIVVTTKCYLTGIVYLCYIY